MLMQEVLSQCCALESIDQTVADSFRDFDDLWLNRDKLPGIISGSAEKLSVYLEQQIESLIALQIPNTYALEFWGPLEQHSLGQRASA